jgi:hypothetical protein
VHTTSSIEHLKLRASTPKRTKSRAIFSVVVGIMLLLGIALLLTNRSQLSLVQLPSLLYLNEPNSASDMTPTTDFTPPDTVTMQPAASVSAAQLASDWLTHEDAYTFISFDPSSGLTVKGSDGATKLVQLSDTTEVFLVESYNLGESGEITGLSYGNPIDKVLLTTLSQNTPLRMTMSDSATEVKSVLIYPSKL